MTSITPTSQHVHVEFDVPPEYVGKNLSVELFPTEEIEQAPQSPPVTMKDFWGIIAPETVEHLQEAVKKSREEWDRDFF